MNNKNWSYNSIVFYEKIPICLVGSTKKNIYIDTWIPNNSFYKKTQKFLNNEGRIKQFIKKYKIQ
uniref:Large ribosomal subunit protein bL31c n=1 Tax=Nitzschia sp. NIES-3576 TaxID=2083273 RepID=A0A2Z5ZB96_9STRA|nr:ribosomal protein L31 [Nitzschia sp. NIES-3576]